MGAKKLDDQKGHNKAHEDDHEEVIIIKKGEEGEGPWLVSYADLMTLLMGFFALVSSMSTPSKENIEKIRESATIAFGGKYEKPYKDLGVALLKVIKDNKLEEQVQVNIDVQGITLTFKGTMFFESGEFIVKPDAVKLMDTLAGVIKSQPKAYKALIEGHTDSVPISAGIIASNWELSGLRAARIAQLFENKGFGRNQLTIIGWGDARPLVPNTDEKGNPIPINMLKNRRVVIRVYDDKISDNPYRDTTQSASAPAAKAK